MAIVRNPTRLFSPRAVTVDVMADGSTRVQCPVPLGHYPRCVGEYLAQWAREAPNRDFLLQRGSDGGWQGVSYSKALTRVRSLAGALLELGVSADRPLAILSDNSIYHGLLSLAAMHVGVAVAPISVAYSLVSKDFARLKGIIELIRPGAIFAESHAPFAAALDAIGDRHDAHLLFNERVPQEIGLFVDDLQNVNLVQVDRAFQAISPDTTAKLLFTSGSTGTPKGVITTHRMLCASQQAKSQIWPFLEQIPPVVVDWLPWNHTFGGSHNFNMVLRNGGTLYIDGGKPAPGLFEESVANLREIAPTIYLNVPRGYDLLVQALKGDQRLRENFFSRLQLMLCAAAALPENLWHDLITLSAQMAGEPIALVSAWGATETSPIATDCYFQAAQSGVIGLPVPGCELKLVKNADKNEVRVRGPNVTPGYFKNHKLTTAAFDDEGFYQVGDAVRWVDQDNPERGLLFDGRVAEDFKLTTGTWVNTGMLRIRALAALAPVAQDVVVAGQDRDEVGFLIIPDMVACEQIASSRDDLNQLLGDTAVRQAVANGLSALRADGGGSSTYATRALLLEEPPSIDDGEITDKGYINQRAVLARRKDLVIRLYDNNESGVVRI